MSPRGELPFFTFRFEGMYLNAGRKRTDIEEMDSCLLICACWNVDRAPPAGIKPVTFKIQDNRFNYCAGCTDAHKQKDPDFPASGAIKKQRESVDVDWRVRGGGGGC